jgi:UDPglucose--hexose-1-phosphate uridylyltransferase
MIISGFDPALHPHRRYDPLGGRHVLVSPHRAARPWSGASEAVAPRGPAFDPGCHLCPGTARASGERNPNYSSVFVFDNDFPALPGSAPEAPGLTDPFQSATPVTGAARVICFSPDHSLTLPELPLEAIRTVVDAWCAESARLGERFASVQVFENKGAAMGCSSPHPHGQIWATDYVPDEVERETRSQSEWLARHGGNMLLDLAGRERAAGERVVVETELWLAIVPYWAAWPFETLLLPRFPVTRLPDLDSAARADLAAALKALTIRYDNLFETSFPYSMGWHGAPGGAEDAPWQLHAHFYPPLLRSASVRKFMVGFELLAEAQRDLTPEQAAERLRAVSPVHYREAAR